MPDARLSKGLHEGRTAKAWRGNSMHRAASGCSTATDAPRCRFHGGSPNEITHGRAAQCWRIYRRGGARFWWTRHAKRNDHSTAGTLSKLWDNGTIDRIRASEGATKLYGRRLSMHLMAQPVIAERAFSDDVLTGQGFLARCLLAWPHSTAGERQYRAESLRDDAAIIRYTQTLAALHARPLPLAEGQVNELQPRRLVLTPDAFACWRDAHDMIEAAMRPGERFARVQAWASKTPEQILRIAGVLTLVESPDSSAIDKQVIERAVELGLWHLGEAARLAGTAEISKKCATPNRYSIGVMRKECRSSAPARLSGWAPPRIRELDRFNWAVELLESAGWATRVEGGAEIGGVHRRNVWSITPKPEAV